MSADKTLDAMIIGSDRREWHYVKITRRPTTQVNEIRTWAANNCTDYRFYGPGWWFVTEEDALAFKLKFG